ncbi:MULTISPECIES: phosphatase PAP2 family protein [unclassified Sphingomonas]|uniref:phosphatase PAP2 family protein n=1 Tax=unclassified Sphingomonas TaxID=196159 RepID=UPI000A7ECB80|nr:MULTISPECIES: phosphatase PAP2 family protein [unclassified Sphingomonas]
MSASGWKAMGKKKQARREAKRGAKQLVDADIDMGQGIAAGLRHHPVVKVAGTLSEVADQPPMVAINLATIAAGLIVRDARLTRTGVRMLAAHGLATLAKAAIKHNVDRARPKLFASRQAHRPTPGNRDEGPQNSFPSGHTAGAVAVARAVAREYPDAAVPVQATAAGIAAIQIPRGTHFPIDVVVGAFIGWAAEAIVARVLPAGE